MRDKSDGDVEGGSHEVEVLGCRVQSSDLLLFTAIAVKAMVVIKADDCGLVGDEGVGLGVTASRSLGVTTEQAGHTAHESGFSASCT